MGAIIRKHGLDYHFYADDTQLYLALQTNDNQAQQEALNQINICVQEIQKWMVDNLLKLYDDKTEIMVFHPKQKPISNITLQFGMSRYAPNPAFVT